MILNPSNVYLLCRPDAEQPVDGVYNKRPQPAVIRESLAGKQRRVVVCHVLDWSARERVPLKTQTANTVKIKSL